MGGRVTMQERNETYTANFCREITRIKPLCISGAKMEVILLRDRVVRDGVWIGNRIIEHLQLVSTSEDYALTGLHTSQITIGHTRSSQSVTFFTSRCLVVTSNGGRSLPLGSRTVRSLSYHLLTA
jgi:hypothetical protein